MSEEKRKVYHYLYNSASGAMEAMWEDNVLIFELPRLDEKEKSHGYRLSFDKRDRRTLVVFDGHIPWGGLPKSGDIFRSEGPEDLNVSIEHVRKKILREEEPVWHIFDNERNEATLRIYRYFLLLPKSVSCVRRYDNRSLRPIYTFIEVNEKGVTWRNSSY